MTRRPSAQPLPPGAALSPSLTVRGVGGRRGKQESTSPGSVSLSPARADRSVGDGGDGMQHETPAMDKARPDPATIFIAARGLARGATTPIRGTGACK